MCGDIRCECGADMIARSTDQPRLPHLVIGQTYHCDEDVPSRIKFNLTLGRLAEDPDSSNSMERVSSKGAHVNEFKHPTSQSP